MELATFLYAVALILFSLLAVLTAVDFARHRQQVHLYTLLLLSTLAMPLLFGLFDGDSAFAEVFNFVQWGFLLAHPLLFLLLIEQFRPLRRPVYALAVVGLLYAYTLAAYAPVNVSLWVILPVAVYFIGVEAYAIAIVWQSARQAQGVVRPRLRLVAVASGLLALIIALVGLSLFWTEAHASLNMIALFLAVFVALGYFLGFVPPAWLNRTWQLAEVHTFLEAVALHLPEERALVVTKLLRETAVRMVAAADVIVACWANRDELLMLEGDPALVDLIRELDNREGLVGRVWQMEQAVVNVGLEGLAEVERQIMRTLKVNTVVGIPIVASKRVWGVVLVFLIRRPIFETADISLLTLLAQQMANILSYTALLADQNLLIDKLNQRERALQQVHDQAQTVAQIATLLNAQVELEAALQELCRAVAQMFHVPVVTISLYDEAKKALYLAYDFGLPAYVRHKVQAVPRELHDAYAQLAGPVKIVPDVQQLEALPNHDLYAQMDLRTTANATMWYGDLLIGRLNIGTIGQIRDFSEQELTLLKGIADQAATAIHRMSLYQQVQAHAAQLEHRVQERTLELQVRNQELDAFAHTVAHDLKSPLALIVGFTDLLVENWEDLNSEEVMQQLNYISHNSHKMTEIVDALLLLASIRQEEVVVEVVDMADIVQDVQMRLAYMIQVYQATIVTPETWPKAVGYGPWLEEVWYNYISNGIKYGGKPPLVQLGADEVVDKQLRFWVRDNGVGIPVGEQARLFEPFTRLSEKSTENGHGLGLSIVERIVNKLGGGVGCESQPEQGSLFYFTMPCADEPLERIG